MDIRVKRGIQWDRFQKRVSRKGLGPLKKHCITNDGYHDNQGEEKYPMG
jgi:hypothetical protein